MNKIRSDGEPWKAQGSPKGMCTCISKMGMNPSLDGAGKYEKRMIVTCDVTNRYTTFYLHVPIASHVALLHPFA